LLIVLLQAGWPFSKGREAGLVYGRSGEPSLAQQQPQSETITITIAMPSMLFKAPVAQAQGLRASSMAPIFFGFALHGPAHSDF
jgi:hypothetical protein